MANRKFRIEDFKPVFEEFYADNITFTLRSNDKVVKIFHRCKDGKCFFIVDKAE